MNRRWSMLVMTIVVACLAVGVGGCSSPPALEQAQGGRELEVRPAVASRLAPGQHPGPNAPVVAVR